MVFVFRVESQNHEKSITELELFELRMHLQFARRLCDSSSFTFVTLMFRLSDKKPCSFSSMYNTSSCVLHYNSENQSCRLGANEPLEIQEDFNSSSSLGNDVQCESIGLYQKMEVGASKNVITLLRSGL